MSERIAAQIRKVLSCVFSAVRNAWWARQRRFDLQILWPQFKERAVDIDHAKAAFMLHAMNDPCWIRYYGEELADVINRLS